MPWLPSFPTIGYLKLTFPATSCPTSHQDSCISQNFKNWRLQKTIWKNCLKKRVVCFIISNLMYFDIFFLIGIYFLLIHPSYFLLATNWIGLRKLQELDVSDNKLTELPALFLHSFKSLSCLNVSRNNLKAFPDAWACPLVSNLPETVKEAVSPTALRVHRAPPLAVQSCPML